MLQFSELSEQEQVEILSEMSREDYDSQHQIYLLAQKMKQSQVRLAPKAELKAQLLAELRPTLFLTTNWYKNAAIAAALIGLIIGYFNFQNPDNQSIAKIESIKELTPIAITPIEVPAKKIAFAKAKKYKKTTTINVMEATESDIAATFHRENPNLVWQNEEEEDSDSPLPPQQLISCEK